MSHTVPIHLDSQLCFAIYSANKNYNHFYQTALSKFDLTYPQFITLVALWDKSPLSVRQLGAELNLDSGTLTPLLKRLEKQGWVSRKRNTEDERQVDINLTDYANSHRDEIYDRVNSCLTMAGIPVDEYQAAVNKLKEIGEKLETVANNEDLKAK
ncbi:MarR family transcriptional regulator [Secundilactobacillus oryzae JCM 18671]|uniref:HTH-type transcriptional regulator SarZ n=1 Tax=Secundilactobacillus oryzae JCM 18671 TaxID=1291743 RepID=A0A081BG71_9LACO|nr:MarR family transcriptional regulator [Secundilactobacillus oryzae]GAK47039.1 MarR family transcriptional regulator [Secundilactobacillus oryzae JCM 18671]